MRHPSQGCKAFATHISKILASSQQLKCRTRFLSADRMCQIRVLDAGSFRISITLKFTAALPRGSKPCLFPSGVAPRCRRRRISLATAARTWQPQYRLPTAAGWSVAAHSLTRRSRSLGNPGSTLAPVECAHPSRRHWCVSAQRSTGHFPLDEPRLRRRRFASPVAPRSMAAGPRSRRASPPWADR